MKRALALLALLSSPAHAFEYRNAPAHVAPPPPAVIRGCMERAGEAHGVPATLLYLILRVEDGRLGRVVPNASGAPPDIGPAQINGIWVRRMAERWRTTPDMAFLLLRDDFCANIEAGAHIAGLALREGEGGFWERFAAYHSRTPRHRDRYLRLVAEQVRVMHRRVHGASAP